MIQALLLLLVVGAVIDTLFFLKRTDVVNSPKPIVVIVDSVFINFSKRDILE